MPRIATLHDKTDDKEPETSDDKETRYVGGTDNRGGGSGLAVLPNGEGRGDPTSDLMSAARAGGSDGRAVSENAAVITMWKSGMPQKMHNIYIYNAETLISFPPRHSFDTPLLTFIPRFNLSPPL